MIYRRTGLLAVVASAILLTTFAGHAQLVFKSGAIVVLAPSNLPEAAPIVLDKDVSSETEKPYRCVTAVPCNFKVIDDTSNTGDPELIAT